MPNSDSSDEDDDLFGGGSDSDDTAELIQQSKKGSGDAKKPAPAAKPKKKPPVQKEAGGLFDSDSSDDDDDDDAKKPVSKKKRMEALAAKKKKQAAGSTTHAKASNAKESSGYASGGSYDSEDFQRTKDDDDFIDTAGDTEGMSELYAEQNFHDEEPEKLLKKSKNKKKRRAPDGSAIDAEPDNPVDAVMQRMKKKKKPKKGKEELEEEVKAFLMKMDAAAESDRMALAEGRLGMERLKIHREVFETLNQRGEFQMTLLEFDGLSTCKRWIEPLPNGQLNNLTLTTKMLDAVGKLPISTDDLKRSGFGKTLMSIGKHKNLPKIQKTVIQNLIERWTRPILKKSGTLKDYDPSKRQYRAPQQQQPASSSASARSPDRQDVASMIAKGKKAKPVGTQRVQVPFGKGFDFHIRPADRASGGAIGGGPSDAATSDVRKQLKKRMVEKSRAKGKNQRSANVSVEGRRTKG